MVIQNTALSMSAASAAVSYSGRAVSYTGWGDLMDSKVLETASETPHAKDGLQKNLNETTSDEKEKTSVNDNRDLINSLWQMDMSGKSSITEMLKNQSMEFNNDLEFAADWPKVEQDSLNNLLGLMSNRVPKGPKKMSTYDFFELLMRNFRERLNNLYSNLGRSSRMNTDPNAGMQLGLTKTEYRELKPSQDWTQEYYSGSYNYESEMMTYSTNGTVVTSDGSEININIDAVMTRSFEEYTELQINYKDYRLVDPLVINYEGGMCGLSDQKFLFDIDMDGEEDNISLLAKGCGFLALDRNGDGIINDGSELFGTGSMAHGLLGTGSTGHSVDGGVNASEKASSENTSDGFAELAVFDMDGNGWIDENDEVFNHLRIWTKDDAGNDKLIALGVAGIGAIYLGNAAAEFTHKSMSDNSTLGKLVSTGIFLKENGEAGIIQQIDLAVEN